jgi:N-acetylglucosamine kinase-like BadF-type ATPase
MPQYFLGLDTGGTKSHALIADENGRVVGFGASGPGNWEVVGWEGTGRILNEVTNQALATAGIGRQQIAGAGFGLAGYDWPEDRRPHVQLIESLGLNAPFELVNDAFLGLLAGAATGWGVAVGAGTSCNCYGRDQQGRIGRTTGFSGWFGEYAGAGELVRKAIQAVAKEWTQRGPVTRLSNAFITLTGAHDVVDLLAGLTRDRYHLSAANARTVFQVAAEGDAVAQSIIRWVGRELGTLALGVIRQLNLEALTFEVVLAGSLYNGSPIIAQEISLAIHALAPGARLTRLHAPPVVGGVVLGMEQAGVATSALRHTLIETTTVFFPQERREA